MYFGVLREVESITLQRKDVTIKEDHVNVDYPHSSKRRIKGFMFKIPIWLRDSFKLCVSQLADSRGPDSYEKDQDR